MFNQGEKIGDLNNNLTLQTKGKVYIQFGKKSIELLNDKGELNVKFPKSIKKVNSLESLSDGFYEYDGNLYYVINNVSKKINIEEQKITELKEGDVLRYNGKNFEYYNIDDKLNEIINRINLIESNLN